jgi:hypothetical protein
VREVVEEAKFIKVESAEKDRRLAQLEDDLKKMGHETSHASANGRTATQMDS